MRGVHLKQKLTYQGAGVDLHNAEAAKREMISSMDVRDIRVLNKPGAFASLFEASFEGIRNPVLVFKAEEPGSKQLLAFQYGKIRNICCDLIHHLVNDIVVMGAKPEVVLDIILCGQIEREIVVEIVRHIAQACRDQDCCLLGGETSEQPQVLPPGSYMLNASIMGVVEREGIIDGSKIRVGDEILAIASNGLHTNGYSLVRKLIEQVPEILDQQVDGEPIMDVLLRPHLCYYHPLKELFPLTELHGLAHITGGGIEGNLNRILPEGTGALINLSHLQVPEIFKTIQAYGSMDDEDMLRTFNMGVGITLVADPKGISRIREHLAANNCSSYVIGKIVSGDQQVKFCQ